MIPPRRLAHRGTVLATGFVIDMSLVGAAEARRRVLSLWRPGAVVRDFDAQLVITGLSPSRVRVCDAPGAPLVEQHGMIAAMPLADDEAVELSAAGGIVVARAGAARVVQLDPMHVVDLASWIDLDELQLSDAASLALPPEVAQLPEPPPTDVRALTGAPAATSAMEDVRLALSRARRSNASTSGVARSLWSRLARWLSDRAAPRPPALPIRTGATSEHPTWLERVRTRFAAALWKSRLGLALGRRHAAYLRRMIELFDRGDLDQALRHAIPLGGGDSDGRLDIGVPRPRESLSLTFGPRRRGSVIPVADAAMVMMRDRYGAAAVRLEQSGRIEEAAFVLSELLADHEAAIALLERHGRYVVAARLGEARGVAPGIIVRLWFLAGERERAIDTARRHAAWADAVARLERSGDTRAAALRMLWAEHLADTGDFVRAVEAAWPVSSSRALIEAWIDRGIQAEGSAAARLLVKKLVIAPASFSAVAPAMLAILAASDPDALHHRVALGNELAASPPSMELRTIARPVIRALVRDCGEAAGVGARVDLVDRLIELADDHALRADRPSLDLSRRAPTARTADALFDVHWSAHDAGVVPVYDAALLPGDRLVLALGELGVRIVGRTGRTLAHIDQPATRLVLSDHGTRALAIARRGQVQRIARLDLVERRGTHWCDAELDHATSTFDGDVWLVTRGRQVLAIDTTASRWRAMWGVDVDPANATCAVRRDAAAFAVEVRAEGALEVWYYAGFTLRARKPFDADASGTEHVAALPRQQGIFVRWPVEDHDAGGLIVADEISADHAIVTRRSDAGLTLACSHVETRRIIARLRLDGATQASARLGHTVAIVGDDRGRVIVIDLEHGVVRRELRTS